MIKQKQRTFVPNVRMILGTTLCLALCAVLLAGPVVAQHKSPNHADQSAQAPASSAIGQTDAPHASLANLAGEYNRVIKFLGQTGTAAAPSSGTCKISVVLGGRFILEESEDTVFGRPVGGLRIYGYNDTTKQYEMARMYTMSNGITLMTGTSSDSGKTIEFSGGTGKMPLHAHFRQTDEDHFSVTMSTTGTDGKDAPFQETDYARRK